MVRRGFRRLIQSASNMEVVGEASTLEEALPQLAHLAPTVVTLDLHLPGISGLAAVELLLATQPDLRILVVSARNDGREIQALLERGVFGYICKGESSESFFGALNTVARGESYLGPQAGSALARGFRVDCVPKDILSKRLTEVLSLIAAGKKTKEIAESLCLSPKTVEKYRGQILRKLEVRNQIEAIQKARELGIL